MADVAGELIDVDGDAQALPGTADFPGLDPEGDPTVGGDVTYFTMVGMSASNTTRDTWEVVGQPDTTAAQYAGGLATPLRDVHVISTREIRVSAA